ncbi:MAG: ADP-forming succinate--CoA ligase subunit beta, partial [Dehalococcoidia bacterium]|nr:ADP-forming succinate--CoA ligase subunit beta [Dehalococcoidia bacterium]
DEAREIAARLGCRVAVKAQILAGGRGKAGGIKMASTPAKAAEAASQILGKRLVTHQTSPEGVLVKRVLVEEATTPKKELYVGIVVDRNSGLPVIMASASGGMEIEEVAAKNPEAILKVQVDPLTGYQAFHGRKLAYFLGVDSGLIRATGDLIGNLYAAFKAKDCSLAEINPLITTDDDRILALDAKLNFDDNAMFRHPELTKLRDTDEEEPLEVEASKYGVSYIKLDGSVGCVVNGAGLAMATMDILKLAGGEPANFLDVGGGSTAQRVTGAFKVLLADPNVKSILINIFGGITRCDAVAKGIVEAAAEIDITVPVVVRLAGSGAVEGRKILADSGLSVIVANDLSDAASKAVAASFSGRMGKGA